MIYAIRYDGNTKTLVEVRSKNHLTPRMVKVAPAYARLWVKEGRLHETALWVDDGKVRRA